MLIPAINGKGKFKFKVPYSNLVDEEQELTVTAIRSINEILASDEDPLTFIYKAAGLTEDDMNEDSVSGVPIVTFITTGSKFIYIPGDMIVSIPQNNGILYQDKVVGINLGSLPESTDLTNLLDKLTDIVYSETGVKVKPEILPASSKVIIDYDKDREFKQLLKNRKKVEKPYIIRIKELETALEQQITIRIKLEEFIKNQFFNRDTLLDNNVTVPELVKGIHKDIIPKSLVTVQQLINVDPNTLTDKDPVTVEDLIKA